MKRNQIEQFVLIALLLLLVACGGGGDGSSSFNDGDDDGNNGGNGSGGDTVAEAWSESIAIDPLILRGNPLSGFPLFSSPAVAADGTIYVGSTDGLLYAFLPDGTVKWDYETGDQVVASPAVGSDGTVYVGSADRQLYAINPDGSLKWVYPTKAVLTASPAIAADGTIYVAGTNLDRTFICADPPNSVQFSSFYAVNPDGTTKWGLALSGPANSSPVIAADGTIYIGTAGDLRPMPKEKPFDPPPDKPEISLDRIDPCDPTSPIAASDADPSYPVNGHVYAIRPNGTVKWDFGTLGDVDSSAAIAADGTIYIGSDYSEYAYKGGDTTDVFAIGSLATGYLYAIDPNGVLIWYTDLFGDVKSSPAVGSDGTIYVGSDKGDVFAVDGDGLIQWVFPTRGPVRSSPALAADGTILIGSNDARLYVLDKDGVLKSEFLANAAIASSPAIANGIVYFATGVPAVDVPFVEGDATLYSIKGPSGLAAGDWTKFRRNLLNTGRR